MVVGTVSTWEGKTTDPRSITPCLHASHGQDEHIVSVSFRSAMAKLSKPGSSRDVGDNSGPVEKSEVRGYDAHDQMENVVGGVDVKGPE